MLLCVPGTRDTVGIIGKKQLEIMGKDTLLINVGRGTAIKQDELIFALNNGIIRGAALDVAYPEPLPESDPLWTAKNLILTPHVSGNMSLGVSRDKCTELFCENLKRYAAGKPLKNVVNRELGY